MLTFQQANVKWKRQVATIDNQVANEQNRLNSQNAFNLSNQAMTFMWQELRDQASYLFQSEQNKAQREAGLLNTILSNDKLISENSTLQNKYKALMDKVSGWF